MSTNGNGWAPRKTIELTCPTGQKVQVRRPGPEFALRSGKVARTFTLALSNAPKREDGATEALDGLNVIADMSDSELAALMIFARELVCTMLVSPKLVLNPRPDYDEIGPDDIGEDFWFLFNYGMTSFMGIKVPVGDTEVEIVDLETFRGDGRIQGDCVDGVHVPVEVTERATPDPRLLNITGT